MLGIFSFCILVVLYSIKKQNEEILKYVKNKTETPYTMKYMNWQTACIAGAAGSQIFMFIFFVNYYG